VKGRNPSESGERSDRHRVALFGEQPAVKALLVTTQEHQGLVVVAGRKRGPRLVEDESFSRGLCARRRGLLRRRRTDEGRPWRHAGKVLDANDRRGDGFADGRDRGRRCDGDGGSVRTIYVHDTLAHRRERVHHHATDGRPDG
jgi:hypothetical protein